MVRCRTPSIVRQGKLWKYQVENKPDDKPKLEVASWLEDVDGKQETRYAFIDEADHKTEDSLKAAKEKIFAAFPGLKECTNPAYHYEVNCLEYRPGTGFRLLVACMFHSIRN